MKTICTNGFKISTADQKALDYYLITTPKEWATKALEGLINKSIKTILEDYLEIYKEKQETSISGNIEEIIPAIISMKEFKAYNKEAMEKEKAQRDELQSIEIWEGGFEIENYQFEALNAFFEDPERTLREYMENKIALRKKAFVKEYTNKLIKLNSNEPIPVRHDALINLITSKKDYKKEHAK